MRPSRGRGRPPRYCSNTCSHAMSRRGVLVNEPPATKDMGPDVPLNGWTQRMEMERREKLAAEMLREGYSTSAVQERFAGLQVNIARVRRKYNIPTPSAGERPLPGGPPVW